MAARDTIPPPWKSASLLALEDQFVLGAVGPILDKARGTGRIQVNSDPRELRIAVDPDSGEVSVVQEQGEVPLGAATRQTLGSYSADLRRALFRRQWAERSRQSINSLGAFTPQAAPARTGLSFELPGLLPKRVQNLLGPGGPSLTVSGSENIRLSGESNWTNQQTGPLGQKRSLFPSLDMQQDLNIRLEGHLSDRINVNLLQNSLNQIPLANRIAINYKGDEDDLIQSLDLGNTNLSLPGTQYVSYSGRNEGLFGVKTESRLGPLDVTLLASKQEGRSERASYTGGATRQTWTIYPHEYIRGVYFLLYDPNRETLDIPDAGIQLYRDDGNYNTTDITQRGRAFADSRIFENPPPPGVDTLSLHGNFRQLISGPDQDYEILHDVYGPRYKVIKMHQPLNSEQRLAVTYFAAVLGPGGVPVAERRVGGDSLQVTENGAVLEETRMLLLRAPISELSRDNAGNFLDTLFTSVRHLELENFYQLPGQRIDASSFQLSIQRGDDEPPKTFVTNQSGESVPYIEVLGLDNFNEASGRPVSGHDNKVDGTSNSDPQFGQTQLFVDYESGVFHFLEPRPFAPRVGEPFEDAVSSVLNRRVRLDGTLEGQNEPNPIIYDRYNPERKDVTYRIVVDFTAQRVAGEIPLGRSNIIEGSEVVTVNGRTWLRDADYTIDYDLGRITLRKQLGPADNLNIDYSYAPLFQQAGRTLVGSAFQLEGRNKSLGGAFLYESRGAQDLRPRLGEEPSRSVIGDLNSKWNFTPDWMTRLVDRLPGVRTTTPSEFNIEAEAGASFPNPNTRNEVFIDDMEGVRDAVSLSMGAERWRWSSVPSRFVGGSPFTLDRLPANPRYVPRVHNAEIHWYSPFAVVKERDLKPSLKDAEGAQNNRQVLAISVPRIPRSENPDPIPGDPIPGDSLWAGLTYPLDQSGIDLSKSQFIELWVNDFNDDHTGAIVPRVRGHHLKLHIDLGLVSEDQQRAPNVPPNGQLDSEDKPPRDNQLVVTDSNNEDTGYDGTLDPAERDSVDLTTASPEDPQGDDFVKPVDGLEEVDTRRFRGTNGVEGNKVIFPYPDTEDLNLNNAIDTRENYFEYTIDLGDDQHPYLVTDVRRDFGGSYTVAADNGWRRYRIPIADTLRQQFGTPDLALARHVRLWVEGIRTPDDTTATAKVIRPLLMLGSLEIVGSRWRAVDLPDSVLRGGSTVTLNSVNTIDNADIYKPPFDPGETRSGNQAVSRREQSISLEFERLEPGATVEAFKTLSIEEDYTRYRQLSWYAASFNVAGYDASVDTSLYYFVRFASDESGRVYYEYKARLPRSSDPPQSSSGGVINWQRVLLPLTDLSTLKISAPPDTIDHTRVFHVGPGLNPGDTLKVFEGASFTRLRRISFGLINQGSRAYDSGQLWFNELRSTDVEKSVGRAQRMLVNGRLSNLLNYSVSYNGRDANFLSVGENRGSGTATDQFGFNTSIDIHRFFEGTGIVLPFTYGYTRNSSKPRFSAGDDIVRSGSFARASESRTDNQNWSLSYSRTWSERSNPLLLYTVGGLTAGINKSVAHTRSPSTIDTSTSSSSYLNYRQSFRKLLAIPVPLLKRVSIFPLPEQLTWAYSSSTNETHAYDRLRDSLASRNKTRGRVANVTIGADLRPIDLLTYHVDAIRNLTLEDALSEHIAGRNIGRNTSMRQGTGATYAFRGAPWLRPSVTWSTSYSQDQGPQISSDLSVRQVSNGQSYNVRWEVPLENMSQRRAAPTDTSHARLPWRAWLSRLGNVSADATLNRTSGYSRIVGSPDFFYLFGFSRDPGLTGPGRRVRAAFGNQIGKNADWRASGRTRLNLGFGTFVTTQVEFTSRATENNGVDQRNDSSRYPDLAFEYGRLPTVIRLDKFLSNPQLRTSYNRNTQTMFQNSSSDPTSKSTASQWQPMLSLRGALKNGSNLELGIEKRVTERENFQLGHSIQTDRQTTVNFSLNRSYTQGQKVAILGKTSTVRSQINMGVSANYEKRSGETRIIGDSQRQSGVRNPTSEDRLSVQGNGSYGFSTNVTGTATLGFQQSRDLQRDILRRSIRIELRGSFTF